MVIFSTLLLWLFHAISYYHFLKILLLEKNELWFSCSGICTQETKIFSNQIWLCKEITYFYWFRFDFIYSIFINKIGFIVSCLMSPWLLQSTFYEYMFIKIYNLNFFSLLTIPSEKSGYQFAHKNIVLEQKYFNLINCLNLGGTWISQIWIYLTMCQACFQYKIKKFSFFIHVHFALSNYCFDLEITSNLR